MKKKQLLGYFGHHKCATVWVHSILTAVCKILALKIEYIHSPKQFDSNLDAFITDNDIDFITYANADIDFVQSLKKFVGFHVIRDPRDIAVSSYFSHLNSHPTDGWKALVKHREKLQGVSKSEGLFCDIEFITPGFNRLLKWNYALPNILEIKMEKLTREPYENFVKIFDFLGILDTGSPGSPGKEISLPQLKEILNKKSFSNLSGGRKKGQEDTGHHFRKGIAGDWVNHFTEEHKRYFKEKHNDLLIKLGYEKDADW